LCLLKSKKTGGLEKKRFFFNLDYLSILFCDFPLIARSGTRHVTTSLTGRAPCTNPRVKDPGNEEAENYWHLNK